MNINKDIKNNIIDLVLNYGIVFLFYFVLLLNSFSGLAWFLFKPLDQFYPLDKVNFSNLRGFGYIWTDLIIGNILALLVVTLINKKFVKNFYILISTIFIAYAFSYLVSIIVFFAVELFQNLFRGNSLFEFYHHEFEFKEYKIYLAIVAMIIVLVGAINITYSNFEIGEVSGESMQNSLLDGDKIRFDKSVANYSRGDIITAKHPKVDNEKVIKRIVGLPGEEIEIIGSKVIITPKGEYESKYIIESYLSDQQYTFQESFYSSIYIPKIKVPDNHFFLLGDNRINSIDSRDYGPVNKSNIIGNAAVAFSKSNDKIRNTAAEFGWVGLERAKYKFVPITPLEQDKNQKIRDEKTPKN
jgi:signal peptidase I